VQVMYKYFNGTTFVFSDFVDLSQPITAIPTTANNSIFNGLGASVFDTWSKATLTTGTLTAPQNPYDYATGWLPVATPAATSIPLRVNVVGLKITIRVWDARTETARQLSIIQDM